MKLKNPFYFKFSLKEFNLFLFSFFSLFSFFNFRIIAEHEIIPLYIIFIFFIVVISKSLRSNFGFLEFLTILFLFCCIPFLKFIYLADFFQLIIVLTTISFLRCIPDYLKIKIANYLFLLSTLIIIFMFLQKLFPSIVDWTYQNLLIRDSSADHLASYTGGVIGIAPEPAYMGSYLIGTWMYVRRFRRDLINIITIFTIIGLVLSASLSANLMFLLLFFLTLNSLKTFLKLILFLGIFISTLFLLDSSVISRAYDFFQIFANSNILNALKESDEYFGSSRLSTLIDPFTKIGYGQIFCVDEYVKGYSFFAKAFYLISPFHLLVIPLIYKWSSDRDSLLSLATFFAFGPVLNWLLYSCFINAPKKTSNDTDSIIKNIERKRAL